MKSILQTEKECYLCGSTLHLEKHHIFMSALRPKSERNGFVVWLCSFHHRDGKEGVHGNRPIDLKLKADCQREYEKTHSRDEWMKLIKRNYLEE